MAVLLVALLLKLPGGAMGRVKLAITGLFLPLFGLTASAHETAERAAETTATRAQLARQNEELAKENYDLKLRLQQETAIWNENARLRAAVGWERQKPWKVRLARVISREPANWWRALTIDLGSRDGIATNQAVLTSDGLVGRVQTVGQTRSVVVLLGNPDLRVAAVDTASGESGIITAASSSPQENNMADLAYLSGTAKVRPGDWVETWGEGGVFPPHIPIGKVVDLHTQEFGLTAEARVALAADIGALREVWVMQP